ncbi:sacsin-like [Dendronephthya gigantea]|uniref:sacsin-like n=1 Tax=Dendronephthya gigantea TaxID=151771 RepID=UPI00106CFAFB|nr:sacsin-like [Dendronephthya gigantea]XP_028405566.1 sacsin-like [Dendronephthya gigantea]XP_028405567.1 sacsin-like [Dendronephthya gigantea]
MAERQRYSGHRLPTLVELIQSILQKYPDGGQILKELIQNADDAGATDVSFLFNEQNYGVESLVNPELARFQGPALYCHNNAVFKEEDWEGIRNLMSSNKKEDPLKIGRFGIGFNSVYHITDLPAIASGDKIAILDPHEEYFRDRKGRGSSVTFFYLDENPLHEKTRDQFMPFHDVFGCDLESSKNYEGTLFRFPLRITPSELSNKGYTKDKVLDLFRSLQEEASVVLLFLKNICSISLYKRSENGEVECTYRVEIAEDSRDKVVKARQEFLEKAKRKCEISESRYVMNVKVMEDSNTRAYRWLIINQIGSGMDRISELAIAENLPPWVGMALPLDVVTSNINIGRIFCFLPLPPDVDCETGLPVHVHGAFALTDNRRGLVWPGADNQSSTAEWNKLLLENVAVDVYLKLLCILLQNSLSVEMDEVSRSQLVYSTLPCKTKVKGHWKVILDPLFQKLSQEHWKFCFAQHVSGNVWIEAQGGVVDRLLDDNIRRTVINALLECSETVITNVPAHVFHILDNYFPSSRNITPALLRSVLKKQNDIKASREDKIKLLEYILKDCPADDIEGVPLLPLADQNFSKFVLNSYAKTPSSSVFVATTGCPRSLLPNTDHRFLSDDIPAIVKDKLQALTTKDAQSNNFTQLIMLNKEIVLQNLRSCLPKEWLYNIHEIVQWSPGSNRHPSECWLEEIWSWINLHFSMSLEPFEGLPLIRLPAKDDVSCTNLGILSKHSKFIFASDISGNSLPPVVVNLLETSGCTVVHNQFSLLKHADINSYVAPGTPTGVMVVLSRASLEKAQEHVKLCTSDERLDLLKFLSRLPSNLGSTYRDILLCLPIFQTLDGSSVAIQTGNQTLSVVESSFSMPPDFQFRKGNQIISSTDTTCQQIFHLLGVKALKSGEILVKFLFPDIKAQNVYNVDETASIMLWIIERAVNFKSHIDSFIEEMKYLPFVPTNEGQLFEPNALYDPSDAMLMDLFHGEPNKFPRHDYCESHVISMLKSQMGLRTRDEITANELFEVATSISTSSTLSAKCKHQGLVKILNDFPEYLNQNVNPGVALKSELRRVKWLPRAITSQLVCPRFPKFMPWYTCDSQHFAPHELCDKSHALVVGSTMPILEIDLSEKVREELGLTSDPPVEYVVSQHKLAIQAWPNLNERKACALFMEMVVAIYTHLARFPKETVIYQLKNAFVQEWIWHGNGFCSPSQIALEMDFPLDLSPQLFILPEELKDDVKLKQFFLENGVSAKFFQEDVISVLPALKQKHENSNLLEDDVEKDLKLCRSILEWLSKSSESLSESMKENLLFPVESEENTLVLKHYKDCAYCDVDWLRRGESELSMPNDEHPLIHNSVPTKIAMTLGVPTLSSCLLSAETLGFEQTGPSEPITTRIHNILEEYKEGVGVFKELIQNADDAGASKVRFLVDWRIGPKDRLLATGMSECQGPALWSYNDGLFSDNDFENINKLAGATKKEDISTIGRFGLGFNAVYHLTDVPSFVSREYFVMFDPNCHHLQHLIRDASRPGIRINLVKNPKPLKAFGDQFQPYRGIFDCNMDNNAQESFHYNGTLFRFPFRTLVQAGKSEISQTIYNKEKVKEIVDSLRESASLLLVYTEHVTEVELFELHQNQTPEQMQSILSVKKSIGSVVDGIPFIKTCSEWWKNKMHDETTANKCPAKSQHITIDLVESTVSSSGEIQQAESQESWLISSCMGIESSSELALTSEGREKGLMPFAETAAKVNRCSSTEIETPEEVTGEAFCFLPLSIQTGLPVHINGYFAIMSNRRGIWERGTTEHDQPFEGEWNANLLSDAIACSYIQLLDEIKDKLSADTANKLQAMLPCFENLHSTTWEPLVKSIYNKIMNESLAFFWCNGKWINIHTGYILEKDLRNAPGVISTMNSLEKNVLDLSEDVCRSFKKSGHEAIIHSRTLTLELFFKEMFFPNISTIKPELREPLVLFGLDCILKGHDELEQLFKDNKSVLDVDGQLKKPADLFDPSEPHLKELFSSEPGKFPCEYFTNDPLFLPVLRKLGMRGNDMIMPDELLNVAKSISFSEYSDPSIQKSRALLNILQFKQEYLSQFINGSSTLKQELRSIKWLPRVRSPPDSYRYPARMPWFDGNDAFFSPAELRSKSEALLIGSVMPVVDVIPESFLVELGIVSELPPKNVIEQLSKAVEISSTDPQMNPTTQFQDMILAIYQHLTQISQDTLSELLEEAKLECWIWNDTGFSPPFQMALDVNFPMDLRPQLFRLPVYFTNDVKLNQFFLQNGVHKNFSEEDIVSILPRLKQKHENSNLLEDDVEKDLKLCRSILEWLGKSSESLSESMKENLLFPVESEENTLVLKHYKDCAYCDVDWLRRGQSELSMPNDEHPLIHNSVPTKIAMTLGVPTLSSCLLSAETLGFEQTGPSEPITTRIHNILEEYKEGVGVFKELIQNADDAGASKVRFLVDWRIGPKERLLATGMSECQGPALWSYNDGLFSDNDFENINKLAGATKKEDISTIGRFGLGFNAVYHLTDVPSFVSREYFVMFDPNCHHLQHLIRDASRPGIRINLVKNPKPLKAFGDQFQPYRGIFDCNMDNNAQESFHYNGTLFRFPFRTLVQAGKSEISQTIYNKEKVKEIVDSLKESASLLLVYTEHVTEVELFELHHNQTPEQMQSILSVKKSIGSVVDGIPFIKTCSEWWKNKMHDETTANKCPAKSQHITIDLVESTVSSSGEIQQAESQESWLISSCMGIESSSELALTSEGREKGLMPFAETAAKVNRCSSTEIETPEEVTGEAFCFLPLSIQTGLPVHINGYFAIMSNRRGIWERGTTEHDQPFEGEWNANLLSDAIACSYIQLLEEIKDKLSADTANKLQAMLPCYENLHSSTWEPLVKSIYNKIMNESLAFFWCNGKWINIHTGYILEKDLRNAPGVISTMNSLEKNVLDLSEDVCRSFKKSGHEAIIHSRTLTLELFFKEMFFPNIFTIKPELREPLVLFGLDCILKGHNELEQLFKDNKSILDVDGQLKKPADLFDPTEPHLKELFLSEPGKFPCEYFTNDPLFLPVLRKLGMRGNDMIMPDELLNVAKSISFSEYSDPSIQKSRALLNILQFKQEYLSQSVNGSSTLKQELRSIKWLPRARSPPDSYRYPARMPWFDGNDAFFSPAELRSKSEALLIGSVMPVVDVIPESFLVELGIVSELPPKNVIEQLSKAVEISSTDPQMNPTTQFQDMILAIYQHLAQISQDTLSKLLEEAKLECWIWNDTGFSPPSQMALDVNFPMDLRPQLFRLPVYFTNDLKLNQFFLENGVHKNFSEEDIVSILPRLKQKHENSNLLEDDVEKDLKLCRSILEWLGKSSESLSESMKENLLFPVESEENTLVLKHYKDCAYCDVDWLRRGESELSMPNDEHPLIHNSVPTKIAMTLGVPTLSSCLLSAETLGFEQTGPSEPITTRIHNILEEYKEGVGVFKELIQNADDAGASKVRFLVDWRIGPKERLLATGMSECQGPALWSYNDGLFSDNDFENINKLAGATKKEDISTIGRFGLGFNAVYHLTDVPSFVSREYFVMFDPNCHHLQHLIRDASRPGIRINLVKNPKPLKAFGDQFQPYRGIFDCNMDSNAQESFHYNGTLFRFPFRTLVQAGKSEISQTIYNKEKVKEIVDSLKESASLLLVYTEHVTEVELFELHHNQTPEQMQSILSVKKTIGSVVDGIPFIKTCSEWWKNKMHDETTANKCPAKSQHITIDLVESTVSSSGEIQQAESQESWLISSCMGIESSSELALTSEGREKGLMPFAETAAKVNRCSSTEIEIPEEVTGEAFCFLPLSIQTGLPVHINGYFAIMSNRRGIWERGTTEHDQPFEGEWNANLLSDAIACSYIQLLDEIKDKLSADTANKLQAMLPCFENLHSTTWEPLVKSIYNKIINESLAFFWCNGKWINIHTGYILEKDLRNAPGVISTMNSLEKNVLDLSEDVCRSFKKSGHEAIIHSRTLTLELFFKEMFFPNISTIKPELREPLVLFGLDCILKGHDELEQLFKDNKSILDVDGQLKKPADLFDPSEPHLKELFFSEPGKFPCEYFTNDPLFLPVLRKLGMRSKDMIMPDELLNVAKFISFSEYSDPSIQKSRALLNILQFKQEYLSQFINGSSTLKQELRSIKWLPRVRSPPDSYRYPARMPWFDGNDAFFSPAELRSKSQALLIGSVMPVVDVIPESFLVELGIVSELPPNNVIEQLSKAVEIWSTDPQMNPTTQFQDMILAIYQHLAQISQDILSELLEQAKLERWIWNGTGFSSPTRVALTNNFLINLSPHLFFLPSDFQQNEALREFFVRNEVRLEFSKEDIISVLSCVKEKHESCLLKTSDEIKRDIELCRFIVEWLVQNDEELSVDLQEKVLVPIQTSGESLLLKPCQDCTYCDHEWLRQGRSDLDIPEDFHLIDESISGKIAGLLGVKPLSTCLMSSEELGFEQTGPYEPLTTRLNNIISEYKEGVGVFKELVQNADDAGATKVFFLIDWREGPNKSLFTPSMAECQGPALWAYNDGVFSDEDFKNINKLAGATKREDLEKIGRFGLGFNAIYHLTDVPSFLSRQYLVIFDPNIQHLIGKITETRPGLRVDLAKNARPLTAFVDQFQPYHNVFQCNTSPKGEEKFHFNGTLFRFPFRTMLQASRSKISQEVYDSQKVQALLKSLKESLSVLMLFTQRVNEVAVYELGKNEDPQTMRLMFSAKKNILSVNLELPNIHQGQPEKKPDVPKLSFLKECSDWWKVKLSKGTVVPSPSRSEIISMEVRYQEDVSLQREKWLVTSCMGNDSSLQLALEEGKEHGLLPCAGTAAKLSSNDNSGIPEAIVGEAFCFLPLSITTGLPVHINTPFAVMSNRRSIWERSSSTEKQDLEVRWNECLMSDAVCNAYIQLLETLKALCENGTLDHYPFHILWPSYKNLESNTWKTIANNVYSKLLGHLLPLLRSNGKWLSIDSGYILADDLRTAPKITEAMQSLNENVFELPKDICETLKECGQAETLQNRTLNLKGFITEFFFPNINELSHEIRGPLVVFGLDCIFAKLEGLESLFKETSCIPCSEDRQILEKPSNLINPRGAAAELFEIEDNRFPVGDEFLTKDRIYVLEEKLDMKRDLLSREEIYDRARSVENLGEANYEKALRRSRTLIKYLNKYIKKLPSLNDDEIDIQEIKFLPFIWKPPSEYTKGLPWKGLEPKKEQFCAAKELFLPRHMDIVGSCCLILSTHEELGCGKPETDVKDVLGIHHRDPSHEQVLQQLDNIVQVWSKFNNEDKINNKLKVLQICQCVYQYLEKYFAKLVKTEHKKTDVVEKTSDVKENLLKELAGRKWIFIEDTFVSSKQVACDFSKSGAPYLYCLPPMFNTEYENLFQMTNVKRNFDSNDFLDAIKLIEQTKRLTPLTERELEVVVTFINELKNADIEFLKDNVGQFYLPDHSNVLYPADELTINSTPWLVDRGDSHSVHKDITPDLAHKLGAGSLIQKRLGKYVKTMGTPFGQSEKLTVRLKNILNSYPCDSGILKELVQNADDAKATEIHFIYDKRRLPCEQVFQNNAKEIQGPALCVYNNRTFSNDDLEGIQKLGIGSKSEDAEKTGRFGIGFNAVYHLTDCPSFITNGETLCMLDPRCRYAPGATNEYPGVRFDAIDKEFKEDFSDVMKGYLEEFEFDHKGSTMFRLPLRSAEMAKKSSISNKEGVYRTDSLLDDFKGEAKRSMLFLNHIRKISFSRIEDSGKLVKVYDVMTSVDKEETKKLETLFAYKKESKIVPTKDIPWQGVTFSLVLSDKNGYVEHWLVHQCFGVNADSDNEEISDVTPHKLKPHGGLAALVQSNQRPSASNIEPRHFAYCFLPLPVRIPLPVHVNGHFAIDSGRRDLWKDADSTDPQALWNTMIKRNVLAPGYACLLEEARKYIPYCERETEDKTSWFFPGKLSAQVGLAWYNKLFPTVGEDSWGALTASVYKFLANTKKPVFPVVVPDQTKSEERPEDVPRRIRGWFSVQNVFFVDRCKSSNISEDLMKILLEIRLPIAEHSSITVPQGFEKAAICPPRFVTPESVVLALRNFSNKNSECEVGVLPCDIEMTTISNEKNLKTLIDYCKRVKNFSQYLSGLPLLLTADSVLKVFSEEEKVYCSEFSDLFPRRLSLFVHPNIVSCLLPVMRKDIYEYTSTSKEASSVAFEETSNDIPTDTKEPDIFPVVLLPLTADVVNTFMMDVFPHHTKQAKTHLDMNATGVAEDWLKRLWKYLQTYSEEVSNDTPPLDDLKPWPIIPTKSKKLVTVDMAKTVVDMTIVGNESDAALKIIKSLQKLDCPCLDTDITFPEPKSTNLIGSFISTVCATFGASTIKKEPSQAVTKSYVAHPHNVPDILNVFAFMVEEGSLHSEVLSDEEIAAILKFAQDGYEKLEEKKKYTDILKKLPFYKAINGKHYKLSDFSEYAVIPADVPSDEIEKLQSYTRCLFLHPDLLPAFEKLLTGLEAGAKRSNADFYSTFILPNFAIFSDEMRLTFLTHIRDQVVPGLFDETGVKEDFLKKMKGTRCIPNKTGEYVHASEFYDPRSKLLKIMEDESSEKFPPPPFNETKWLDFLQLIGMVRVVSETLFMNFANRVSRDGNLSPTDDINRKRSRALLSFLMKNHHLHNPGFLRNLSSVKFVASEKVEDVYLSLHKQYCCHEGSDQPPFVYFSNAVLWKYRSLVWTSANLLPEWNAEVICNKYPDCKTENLHEYLGVKYPTLEMVIKHTQNISGVLFERSKKEELLPQNLQVPKIMDCIYKYLQVAAKCPKDEICDSCSDMCKMIGDRLANCHCILVDDGKVVVKGDQITFKIPEEKSLKPFIYQVPREYGYLEHLLKRLGATETITQLQLVSVFKKLKDRTKDVLNPEFEKKSQSAMFLFFNSVLDEAKDRTKQSSIAHVQELYLPSVDKRLIKSSDLLCKIPPKHIKTIENLSYHALCFFEICGLKRELESEYLEALPAKLRPRPFTDIITEKLDESCLKIPCRLCIEDGDCQFITNLKGLLKSEEFMNGIVRLLKHQKNSSELSQELQQTASRFLSNKVEVKCMETVLIHLMLSHTNEVLHGSSKPRLCFVVKRCEVWTLYIQHDKISSSLAKSINKILDWKIKDEFIHALSDMLNCSAPLEISGALNNLDIKVDAGVSDDLKPGSEVPVVFHQLLQQNPLFVFHIGELVAYGVQLENEDVQDTCFKMKYVLAEVIRRVPSSGSVEGRYDFEARYLIDIGNEKREVSVLDLYKFYEYLDENSCKDLVPFEGDSNAKPESYDAAKREILEALKAAWRLTPDLRRKAIRRLYLRWHPDKNPNNVEFATKMMTFLLEQIQRMKEEEERLSQRPDDFDYNNIFQQCDRQASRDNASYTNFRQNSGDGSSTHRFSGSGGRFTCDPAMFAHASTYTVPSPREARRWIEQAEGDLSVCQFLVQKPFDAMACFMSQQIVEKSLKAALYAECGLTNNQLHTHDVYSLARDLNNLPRWKKEEVLNLTLNVANYYLPTRYPNQLSYPNVPHNAFGGQSGDAYASAAELLRLVKEFIRPKI